MSGTFRFFWAMMTIVIIMAVNIGPAGAQARYRRDGGGTAAAPAPGGQCAPVDAAYSTLAALCQNPAYANCPRCTQLRPCMKDCTPGTGTVTPPPPKTVYVTVEECAPNQPTEAGCRVDANRVACATGYVALTADTTNRATNDPHVREFVKIKRCMPASNLDPRVPSIIAKLDQAIVWLQRHETELQGIHADIEGMKKQIAETRQLAIATLLNIGLLQQKYAVLESGLVALDQQLRRVKEGTTKLEMGLGGVVEQRAASGTAAGGLGHVGFSATIPDTKVVLWADAQFTYGQGDGVRLDGSKGPIWTAGGGAGIGTTFDSEGRTQGRLGFRASQAFVTGIGESDRGFFLGGVGSVGHTFSNNLFLRGEVGLGGGKVGHYSQYHAMVSEGLQIRGSLIAGWNTDILP